MDTIKVRAVVRVLGLDPGDEVEINETPLIRGALKNGYLERVVECDAPAGLVAPPAGTGVTASTVLDTAPAAAERRGKRRAESKDDGSTRHDQ